MPTRSPHLSHTDSSHPWYAQRWPWPWLLMLGPVLVIIAGAYTCYLALTRPDAVVVDNYYIQGNAINQDLRRDLAAATLGLRATLRYDPASVRLAATLEGFGQPLSSTLRVHLVHLTQPEKGIVQTLAPDTAGNLTASLPMLEQTRWRVLIENPARDWRLAGQRSWPTQQGIALRADAVGAARASTAPVH